MKKTVFIELIRSEGMRKGSVMEGLPGERGRPRGGERDGAKERIQVTYATGRDKGEKEGEG
ncbi:MAG: hypothetical protein QFX35_06105 [Candidatus Verstraetearchaeota archaeon]|nr:hypothetical protein [Candidatus Verstraetearchaeota archaeon]